MAFHLRRAIPSIKFKLNLDVEKILSVYKDEGFAAAQMEPFTTTDATNHVTITFFITEGTQVLVDAVEISGVTAFKLNRLKSNEDSPARKCSSRTYWLRTLKKLPSSTKIAATRTSKCLNLNRPLTRTKRGLPFR